MALHQLSMASLPLFDDGRLAEAFNTAIRMVIRDCDDRAGLDKVRKLTLTISFKPIIVGNELDNILVSAEIGSNVPKVGSPMPTKMRPRWVKDGLILTFNDESPADPNQTTISDISPEDSQ